MTPATDNNKDFRDIDPLSSDDTIISFLVTNYNYADFLYKAVKSIALQTWPRIEVIIIDDGSTDDSIQVVRRLMKDFKPRFEKFKFIGLSENKGKIHALNIGINEIEFPITIILDADDMLTPQFTEKTVSLLQKEIQKDDLVAFVYTDCMYIDKADNIIGKATSRDFDPQLLQKESYILETAPTLTSVLKDVTPLDEKIKVGTKHHKWKTIVKAGWRGVHLPAPLLKYRMHNRNISKIGDRILKNSSSGDLLTDWKPNPNE